MSSLRDEVRDLMNSSDPQDAEYWRDRLDAILSRHPAPDGDLRSKVAALANRVGDFVSCERPNVYSPQVVFTVDVQWLTDAIMELFRAEPDRIAELEAERKSRRKLVEDLGTELSDSFALSDRLAGALEMADARLQAALKGTPIRDADEVIERDRAALAAYRERNG